MTEEKPTMALLILTLLLASVLVACGGSRRTATLEPTATPEGLGNTWTRPTDRMVMVYVPGGTFRMGSTEAEVNAAFDQCKHDLGSGECERSWFEGEFPQHSVTLDSFWIDKYEVTNAKFAQCVADDDCEAPTTCEVGEPTYEDASKADHPVVCVNWYEADAYCKWAKARLPTEAEWEYAARGPRGNIYPWGNDEPDCDKANYWGKEDGCVGNTTTVGSPGASWVEALDMAGNVWEWVNDWYSDYPSAPQTNPTGPTEGDGKVLRGGSCYSDANFIRSTLRNWYPPDPRFDVIGFRCVVASTP